MSELVPIDQDDGLPSSTRMSACLYMAALGNGFTDLPLESVGAFTAEGGQGTNE
jgi:hypothetical protein